MSAYCEAQGKDSGSTAVGRQWAACRRGAPQALTISTPRLSEVEQRLHVEGRRAAGEPLESLWQSRRPWW